MRFATYFGEPMEPKTLWDWLLRDTTVAGVTWLGTLLGGAGLAATYRQARAARNAADAAVTAVQTIRSRMSIANLAYSYSQVELVRSLVQNGHLSPAQAVFHSLKRMILEACSSFAGEARLASQIRIIERNIDVIELHMDLGIQKDPSFRVVKVTKALAGIGSFLASREQDLKFAGEG